MEKLHFCVKSGRMWIKMEINGKKWCKMLNSDKIISLRRNMLIESYIMMDTKRRISIPTRYRDYVGKSVAITRHTEGCLAIYPMKIWEKGETKVQQLNKKLSINSEHSKLSRFLTTGEQIDVDAAGRILISERLSQFANLEESVVFVGTEDGFQLWSKTNWDKNGMLDIEEARKLADSTEFRNLNY